MKLFDFCNEAEYIRGAFYPVGYNNASYEKLCKDLKIQKNILLLLGVHLTTDAYGNIKESSFSDCPKKYKDNLKVIYDAEQIKNQYECWLLILDYIVKKQINFIESLSILDIVKLTYTGISKHIAKCGRHESASSVERYIKSTALIISGKRIKAEDIICATNKYELAKLVKEVLERDRGISTSELTRRINEKPYDCSRGSVINALKLLESLEKLEPLYKKWQYARV